MVLNGRAIIVRLVMLQASTAIILPVQHVLEQRIGMILLASNENIVEITDQDSQLLQLFHEQREDQIGLIRRWILDLQVTTKQIGVANILVSESGGKFEIES